MSGTVHQPDSQLTAGASARPSAGDARAAQCVRRGTSQYDSLLSYLRDLNSEAFVGKTTDLTAVHLQGPRGQVVPLFAGQGVSALEYIAPPVREGETTEREAYYEMTDYLASWLKCFPGRRITDLRMSIIKDSVMAPFDETLTNRYFFVVRFHDNCPQMEFMDVGQGIRQQTEFEKQAALIRQQNRQAARGLVCKTNGRGWALVEFMYTPPVEGELPQQTQNGQYVRFLHLWNMAYPGRVIEEAPLIVSFGQNLNPYNRSYRCLTLVRFREDPLFHSGVDLARVALEDRANPRLPTHYERLSNRMLGANRPAAEGYVARNGYGYSLVEYCGPPPLDNEGELGVRPQLFEILKILHALDNRYPQREILRSHFSQVWGQYLIDPLNRDRQRSHATSFYTLILNGFYDPTVDHTQPSKSDKPYTAPVLRPPVTELEKRAAAWNEENKINEEGVINEFGEGWASIEMMSAPLQGGERTLQEQNEEWVKTLVLWHDKYPDREILESHFTWGEGAYMDDKTISILRRLLVRFVDRRFAEKCAAGKISPTPVGLEAPETHYQKLTALLLDENRVSGGWHGVEDNQGRGFAWVQMIGQPPGLDGFKGKGVRQQMNMFLRLLNQWSREFPGRQIEKTQCSITWDSHLLPQGPEVCFGYNMLIHFTKRGTGPMVWP